MTTTGAFSSSLGKKTMTINDLELKDQAELKIKAYVFRQRIQISDFFRDFDVHNCYKITPNEFERGLLGLRMEDPINQEQKRALIQHYSLQQGSTTLIRWKDFCNEIEEGLISFSLSSQHHAVFLKIWLN